MLFIGLIIAVIGAVVAATAHRTVGLVIAAVGIGVMVVALL